MAIVRNYGASTSGPLTIMPDFSGISFTDRNADARAELATHNPNETALTEAQRREEEWKNDPTNFMKEQPDFYKGIGYHDETTTLPTYAQQAAALNSVAPRQQDTAQFLVKMAPEQTASVFKSVGLDDNSAQAAAQIISSKDWSNVKEQDLPGELGKLIPSLDSKALDTLGQAMFSRKMEKRTAGVDLFGSGYTQNVQDAEPGKFGIKGGDADHNNVDYKKFTVYDPNKGIGFTGGFVPEPTKRDWMGDLVLSGLMAGVGLVVAPLAANAAVSAFPSLGTVGYAGAIVPGTTATVIGGATAGALTGGLNSDAHGGTFAKGAKSGGILGGIGGLGTPSITGNRMVDSGISGAVRGGIGSKLGGGDVSTGIIAGGLSGAVSPLVRSVVPGAAGNMVNGYVNTAIRASIGDSTPSVTPSVTQPVTEPSLTGPIDLNTTRRIVRR